MTKQRGAKAGGEQVAELSLRPSDPLDLFGGYHGITHFQTKFSGLML